MIITIPPLDRNVLILNKTYNLETYNLALEGGTPRYEVGGLDIRGLLLDHGARLYYLLNFTITVVVFKCEPQIL